MLSFFWIQTASAQVDFRNFSLDLFKLPDIDRSALTFSGSLFGNYSNLNISEIGSRSHISSISPQLGLNYSRFINREDIQATYTVSTSHDLSLFDNKGFFTSGRNKGTDFDSRSSVSADRRRYKGSSFFETGVFVSYSNFYHQSSINKVKENHFGSDFSATIGFGKGRLEPVADVAMAMFILKDAIELGLDGSSINTENIYAFASRMAEARNKRIFDFRRFRIQELRDLYNFMLSQQWVIPNDPGYFTVLTDNWIYNSRFFRNTGKRWSYLLVPEVDYDSDHEQSQVAPVSKQRGLDLGTNLVVDFTKAKPKSLYMDNVREHRLSAGLTHHVESNNDIEESSNYFQLHFDNNIGKPWYPDNRTIISLDLNADYSFYKFIDPSPLTGFSDQHIISPGISAQLNYFISYRTQFVGNALIQYTYNSGGTFFPNVLNLINTNGKSNGFGASLNASLVVAIF